jgi:DNA replication and repair protein RecF
MHLTRLEVDGVRVLEAVSLVPDSRLNVLFGENGAGKTSVLEAVHLLGTGRSFRTRELDKVVRRGVDHLRVVAELAGGGQGAVRVGVEKGPGGIRLRRNGQDVQGFATVARECPLAVFGAESQELVFGGPERRRGLMDWALFHVEPRYGECLQRYRRALRQRNAALRAGGVRRAVRVWDEELVREGLALDRWRGDYALAARPHVAETLRGLWTWEPELGYQRGWPPGESLGDALERTWETDRHRGWTSLGPQVADLQILVHRRPARDVLSRGEAKALVAALVTAHVEYLRSRIPRVPVVLADDLPSELDARVRGWFVDRLIRLGAQVFLTALDPALIPAPNGATYALFHVKQGQVSRLVS